MANPLEKWHKMWYNQAITHFYGEYIGNGAAVNWQKKKTYLKRG